MYSTLPPRRSIAAACSASWSKVLLIVPIGIIYGILLLMDKFTLGYVVGVLAIKGTFVGSSNQPTLQVKSRNRTFLVTLRSALGGVIYGPYSGTLVWVLRGQELEQAITDLAEFLPFLR
jgi:hypothetical protein